MALIPCPECKAEISTFASACPKCGAPQRQATRASIWPTAGIFLGACVVVFGIYAATRPETQEDVDRRQAKSTIDECWKNQARKSIDERTGQFIADVCERLEGEYRDKFRREP